MVSSTPPNLRFSVAQLGLVSTPDDLARTVVEFRNGVPIRLGDVAEVKIGHPAPIRDAVINHGPGILLIVEKQPWGKTPIPPPVTGVQQSSTAVFSMNLPPT